MMLDCINLLSTQNKHKQDDDIIFYKKNHIYYIKYSQGKYISVTKLLNPLFPNVYQYNKQKNTIKNKLIIGGKKTPKKAILYGTNEKDFKEIGVKLHQLIYYYSNGCPIKYTNIEFNYFLNFLKDYPEFIPYRSEWLIYNRKYRIVGMVDMVYKKGNEDEFMIIDWKRSYQLSTHLNHKSYPYALSPIDNLKNNKENLYYLQLNLYRYILIKDYDINVSSMYICLLHPKLQNYQLIKVPIMKREVKKILKYRKYIIDNT